MHNLRKTDSATLSPVLPPVIIASGDFRPVAEIKTDGGSADLLVVTPDNTLAILDPATCSQTPVCDFKGEVLCAIASDDRITAMTTEGPLDLKRIGEGDDAQWCDMDPRRWPSLSLVPVYGDESTAVVPSRELSTVYNQFGRPLLDVDRRAVTADLRRAYTEIVRGARARGAFCAPVIARCRLIGHSGETLCTTPPVLLGSSSDSMLHEALYVRSRDNQTLDAFTVSVPTFTLGLVSNREVTKEMADAVSRIEILAAPQFHPFDPVGEAEVAIGWMVAGDTQFRILMPGASRALSSANKALGESRLRAMLSVLPSVERVVAVVSGPFKAGELIMGQPELQFAFGDLKSECAAVEKAVALSPRPVDPVVQAALFPHSLLARCVARVGDTLAYGNLSLKRFSGHSIESLALEPRGEGPWRSCMTFSFTDGEQLVKVEQGESRAPLSLNPLICWPGGDLASITILLQHGGKTCRKVLRMRPDPSGRWSYYINEGFAPLVLSDGIDAFVVPPEHKIVTPLPGYLALARSDLPASPVAVAPCCSGVIHSLFPASRSQSSWDFSKVRFSVLTSAGAYTLTVSSGKEPRISLSLIDPRASPGPGAAVMAGNRLLAILATDLTEISVTKAKDLINNVITDDSLLITNSSLLIANCRELQIGSKVIDLRDGSCYTRDECVTGPVVGHFAVVGGNLCDFSRGRPVSSVYVRCDGRLDFGDRYIRPRRLVFDIRSPQISYGELTVSRVSHADTEPAPSLRLNIDGAVGSPLVVPLSTLPLRALNFTFQGRLHPSTIIRLQNNSIVNYE